MHCAPLQTMLYSRCALQRLGIQYSVLFSSSFPCWQRSIECLQLCQDLTYTDIRLQGLYADRTRPLHTIVTGPEAQVSKYPHRLPPISSPASSDSLGRRMTWNESLAMPTTAASLGRPLLCKSPSSFPAIGKPSAGPADSPSDPGKDQQEPCQASGNKPSSQQEPLLGLKKKSHGPVAVAISGGVDSAVAAMLLKNAG